MCPYARFQSSMFDADTLIVSYDKRRGEPRAPMTRSSKQSATGSCIDCSLCVQVCPTGIDIRNGLQYQCISCGLCIDACNTIMDSLGWERGLIRYDSESNLNSEKPQKPHLDFMRLKVLGYLVALTLMTGVLVSYFVMRSDFELRVMQSRQPLFITLSDGTVRNRYEVHIVNKTQQDENYLIKTEGIPAAALSMGNITNPVVVHAGKDLRVPVKVDLDPATAGKTRNLTFIVVPQSAPENLEERRVSFDSRH